MAVIPRISQCFLWHAPAHKEPSPITVPRGCQIVELLLAGRGWWHDGNAWREAVAGDLLWHQPGEPTLARRDPADPYRCLAVHWATGPEAMRYAPRASRWPELDQVRAFAAEAVRRWVDERHDRLACAAWMHGCLLWQALAAPGDSLPPPLTEAIKRLDRDPAARLGVDSVARMVGWSPRRLHAAFRQHLGSSPHRWLLERRCRLARELMAGGGLDLSAIAGRCGFASAGHLARTFRRLCGEPPSSWRSRHARRRTSA